MTEAEAIQFKLKVIAKEMTDVKAVLELNKEVPDAIVKRYSVQNHETLISMIKQALDTLAALTKNKYGEGHSNDYWSRGNNPEKEFFVHSIETYFEDNAIMKVLMPKIYSLQKKYIKNQFKLK